MDNTKQLPTAATSFYSVRKSAWKGKPVWWIVLVTPNVTTSRFAAYATCDEAISAGKAAAERVHRPFKYRGAH